MPRVGGARKKTHTHKDVPIDDDEIPPRTFIVKRGKVSQPLKQLIKEMRFIMYPNTATKLKESKNMPIKDYVHAASVYGVSHLIFISMTEKASYMKFAKLPDGPTLTFKISGYSLSTELFEGKQNPKSLNKNVFSKPLLVLNGMGSEESQELKICSIMLQSLFPPINAAKTNAEQCKRVVLFNTDGAENPTFDFRHYKISTKHRDINKSIKKVMTMSSKLDLSKYNDISEFALKTGGYGTDSEAEDLPESKVVLPGDFQGKPKGTKVAVRLEELGPRMKLELIKIQEGLFKGNVLYHRYIKKTKQEIKGLADASKEKHQKEKDEKVKKEAKETRRHKNPEEIFDQDSKDNRDDKRPLKKKKVTFTEFE